jgi:thymidylate synthase
MKQYLEFLQTILDNDVKSGDRTGTGTYTLPSYRYVCEMQKDEEGVIHNFPLLTTKRMSLKSVFEELIWKLRGDTNIRFLVGHKNHIWTEWPFKKWLQETGQDEILKNMWKDDQKSDYTDEWKSTKRKFEEKILNDDEFCKKWGELGRTYGHQFRRFGEIKLSDFDSDIQVALFFGFDGPIPSPFIQGKDQLMLALDKIKNKPEDRRIIISLWNPADEDKTLLPPCPCFYQFFANEPGMLHLNMYQRSCDTFLGVPYNTAQDALFLCMMAHVTERKPGRFNHFFGDAHIYLNLVDQVKEQLTRTPHPLPSIRLNPEVKNILDFTWGDIELIGYEHDAGIKGAVSI